MLSVGLIAIDSTILATAVPSVVEDLGGFSEFPWLFSVYLLAQAVTVPIYGKVADVIGRKPVMLLGIAVFLVGSLLCGVAWGMTSLIIFRAVQGLGAGAIIDRKSTRLNSSHSSISYAVFCLKKKKSNKDHAGTFESMIVERPS